MEPQTVEVAEDQPLRYDANVESDVTDWNELRCALRETFFAIQDAVNKARCCLDDVCVGSYQVLQTISYYMRR